MDNILMNSENSKTSDTYRLSFNLPDKTGLRRSEKYVALSNPSIYYRWKNAKNSYKSNKFEISTSPWYGKHQLPDGLCSVSDIQDYYEHIIIRYETVANNAPIRIYLNKTKNRIKFKIKARYYFQFLKPKMMKSL